jgi:hypothetical protein
MPTISLKLTPLEHELLLEILANSNFLSKSDVIRNALIALERELGLIIKAGGTHARSRDRQFITARRNRKLCHAAVRKERKTILYPR